MSIEDRLQATLRRRAKSLDVRPDPDDVERRSTRRRLRTLGVVLAVVVVAGPTAGFAVGRAVGDDGTEDERSVRADGPPSVFGDASGPAPGAAAEATGPLATGPLERLFVRTTDDGVAIRAYRSAAESGCQAGTPGCPPPECAPVGAIQAELSDEFAVGFGYGNLYAGREGAIAVSAGYAGVPEASPMAWAVVQVGDEVATVRGVLDGAEDEIAPVDGIAVLAAHVPAPPTPEGLSGPRPGPVPGTAIAPSGTVEALAADGSVIATADLTTATTAPPVDPDACEPEPPPPPTLPDPNGPPPADEEAARAEIIEAWETGYNNALPDNEQFAVAEGGPEVLVPLTQQVMERFPGLLERGSTVVKEVRFLNEREATVLYDTIFEDYNDLPNRVGLAKLIDGQWIIGREGYCQDFALAGVTCPPQ